MPRRPADTVVCTVIECPVHEQLVAYKKLIRARTLSAAVAHALRVATSLPVSSLLATPPVDGPDKNV